MILGIKYCGGCNPTFDRGAAVAELKRFLSDLEISFAPYNEKQQFDCCLLVRGCNRSCVSDKKFSNCKYFYSVSGKEDFMEIKNQLYACLTKQMHME